MLFTSNQKMLLFYVNLKRVGKLFDVSEKLNPRLAKPTAKTILTTLQVDLANGTSAGLM